MKNSTKKFLVVTFAALGLTALTAQAQGKLTNLNFVSVALTLQSQGSFSDDGTTKIYATPVTRKLSTKDLLNQLARDEFAEENYSAATFPSGARLALADGSFVVVDSGHQLLVDVSDIVQLTSGTNILTGRISDTTGLAKDKTTQLILVTLNFDDTFISGGGNLSYSIQGVDTAKTKDLKLITSYQETASDSVKNGSGQGQVSGTPFVVNGSISGSRSETFSLSLP
jgi:hypothetical protein